MIIRILFTVSAMLSSTANVMLDLLELQAALLERAGMLSEARDLTTEILARRIDLMRK